MLPLAANSDWPLHQLDVKNAFLNSGLEEVFMTLLQGFEIDLGKNKVCQLNKSLYRVKQSPKAWFERFGKVVTSFGFLQNQVDHTIFCKHSTNNKIIILIVCR